MDLHYFLYGIYPYIVLAVFLLGSWLRFDYAQYSWKSDSSQLLSKRYLRLGSNLFHVGVLVLFLGHFAGLVMPVELWHSLGISDLTHQWIAIIAGTIFGMMALAGAIILLIRRLTNSRVKATSRFMDIFILIWLILTLLAGLSTLPASIHHAYENDPSVMLVLGEWVQSGLSLQIQSALLNEVDWVFKIHLFFGLTVFLLFPFSRLVHIWSAPLGYLMRAYQIVRRKPRTL